VCLEIARPYSKEFYELHNDRLVVCLSVYPTGSMIAGTRPPPTPLKSRTAHAPTRPAEQPPSQGPTTGPWVQDWLEGGGS